MHIIPVLDLLDGQVVHARYGERHAYQPISSQLTPSSNPIDIVKAFIDIYPFKTLYIADLNAIQSIETDKNHESIIHDIRAQFPKLSIWLDAGLYHTPLINNNNQNIIPVLGSESFSTIDQYQIVNQTLNHFILSIDIKQQGYTGPDNLLEMPNAWPENVIIMTLAKVGSNSGVDLSTLSQIQQVAPMKNFYAAGGIRHLADLKTLASVKIKGALIASALHNKQLTTQDITHLMT